jgi:hypothetical protein
MPKESTINAISPHEECRWLVQKWDRQTSFVLEPRNGHFSMRASCTASVEFRRTSRGMTGLTWMRSQLQHHYCNDNGILRC